MGSGCVSCGHLVTRFNAAFYPALNFRKDPGNWCTTCGAVAQFDGLWETTFRALHKLVDGRALEPRDNLDSGHSYEGGSRVERCGEARERGDLPVCGVAVHWYCSRLVWTNESNDLGVQRW